VRRSGQTSVRLRELDLVRDKLLSRPSLHILTLDHSSLDNLDTGLASTMTSSQVTIHLLHSSNQSRVPELLVHIVGSRTRVVSHPDAKVLDDSRVLLKHLMHRDDFSVSFLHSAESLHVVPEPRTSLDDVISKDLHLEDRRIGILL
jgi:hypothetical protein